MKLTKSLNTLVFLLITVLTGQLIQRIEDVRYEAMLNAFEDSDLALICIKNDCSFSRPGISQVSHVLNECHEETLFVFLTLLNLIIFVTILLNKLVSE